MSEFWKKTAELDQSAIPFVVITMLSSRGHAPQDPGSKAIVCEEGLVFGTVGGGKIEAHSIKIAQGKLCSANVTPELFTWNLQRDIGMTCGGEVTFLFELHARKQWPIVIFGAGHVSQALVRLLIGLECHVTCIDSREEWVERLPTASNLNKIVAAEPAKLVKKLKNSYFVSMTQGHSFDVPILEEIFLTHSTAPYIGVIGSEVKGKKIISELKERGIPAALLECLRCPIGLPLGTNHPGEIAVSIVAELLQVRDRIKLEPTRTNP